MRAWDPFAGCTAVQREQFDAFGALLLAFNKKHNLIARGTEAHFHERHLLHCLALTVRAFPAGCVVADWGSGGGLPAIPIAIRFPAVSVVAIDAVGKKVQAVRAMARRLGLANLTAWHGRAEAYPEAIHYSISRATAPLRTLWGWHSRIVQPWTDVDPAVHWTPGLHCLKGGDLSEEMQALAKAYPGLRIEEQPLQPLLGSVYFRAKALVSVQKHGAASAT